MKYKFAQTYTRFMNLALEDATSRFVKYQRNGLNVIITGDAEQTHGSVFTSLPIFNKIDSYGRLCNYGVKFASLAELYGLLCVLGQYSDVKVNSQHWKGQEYLPQPFHISSVGNKKRGYHIYFAKARIVDNYMAASLTDAKKHVQLLASFLPHQWKMPLQSRSLLIFSGSGQWIDSGLIMVSELSPLYEKALTYGSKG